jgi:phospholipase/carboxylesterase
MSGLDELTYRLRPAAVAPEGALVLMHGRGADEHDLVPLLDALDPARRLVGLAPRGPLSLPPGGAHWYVVPRVGFPDPPTFRSSFDRLALWLEGIERELGIPSERTVLGGFSQGAVMAYALGLGAGRARPAGVLALSGFLPTVPGFELDLDGRAGLPVAIGHGIFDGVISVEFARQARERLEAADLAVRYRESGLAHGIDPAFVRELQAWLPGGKPPSTSQLPTSATAREGARGRRSAGQRGDGSRFHVWMEPPGP